MQDVASPQRGKIPLRERRRLETAREIQQVTLKLAVEHGLANVTTEMIASGVGISQRTFFNYFPNKEMAAVGPPIEIDREGLHELAMSQGRLDEDLLDYIGAHCRRNAPGKEQLRVLVALIEDQPHLAATFFDSMRQHSILLAEALSTRMGPGSRPFADLLSEVMLRSMALTFYSWAHDPEQTIEAAIKSMRRKLIAAGQLLCGQPVTGAAV